MGRTLPFVKALFVAALGVSDGELINIGCNTALLIFR
jgi:hypothetical protein